MSGTPRNLWWSTTSPTSGSSSAPPWSRPATTTAGDGETALEVLERAPADLVLLDLHMPGLSGMEVLRRLRDAGNEVPVIFVTAPRPGAQRRAGDEAGGHRLPRQAALARCPPDLAAEVLERHAPRPACAHPAGPGPGRALAVRRRLDAAKRALNHRSFDEAEAHLRRAIGLKDDSAEVHNLMGVLHEMRAARAGRALPRVPAGPHMPTRFTSREAGPDEVFRTCDARGRPRDAPGAPQDRGVGRTPSMKRRIAP